MKNQKMIGKRTAVEGEKEERRKVVQRAVPGAGGSAIPVELSAAERAAIREVVRDPRSEGERALDTAVERLMRELGG